MERLEYQTARPATKTMSIALIVLPTVAVSATMIAFVQYSDEPFVAFRVTDALILLGSPIVVTTAWIAAAILVRRRRLPAWEIVPWLLFALLTLAFSLLFCRAYLREPWNQ